MDNNNEQKVLLNKAKELYEAGDADGALKIYEELAALGDPFDMIEAAALLFEKNDPKADKKAFKYVLKASKSTDKAADYLCICYGLGRGTKTSYSEAVRYGEMAMKAIAEDDIAGSFSDIRTKIAVILEWGVHSVTAGFGGKKTEALFFIRKIFSYAEPCG